MHIQERSDTTLTTCTKMTEEVDRRLGVNGNSSGNGASEDVPVHIPAHTSSGGRLKFFKDGKFILELVRGCAREGERASWVSVPRKTFWPPAAAPGTPPAPPTRSDRAASLSVSDDNSSIQSSPWQRDHCWKQSNPRKNISKELALYYCRPNTLSNNAINTASRQKRRRPHDTTLMESLMNGSKKPMTNGLCDKKKNGDIHPEDTVDGSSNDRWTDMDRDKYYYMKLKKPYQYHKLRVYKKCLHSKRKELVKLVDRLHDKMLALPAPVNAKIVSCKQEHMMVSPRKRILREFERVSLEDSSKRRARPPQPAPGPSQPRKPSSYSISSLLMPDETPRRYAPSPETRSPVPTPPPVGHQYNRYYRDAYYGYIPPPLYRAPPLWLPIPPAWTPHPLYTDHIPKDEHNSDVPLNLSKH